jgi:hypothetical protein
LPETFRAEVRGLTEEQLDRQRMDKSWGHWSIRIQVSHVAWLPYLHFLGFWGETLFGNNLPRDIELFYAGGADRMLDPKKFQTMDEIFVAFDDSFALAREILAGETLGSLREKVLSREVSLEMTWVTGENVREYIEGLVLPAHPDGYWKDENNPDLFYQTLETAFRHIPWEAYAHLKTIQMHKREEGMPPVNSFPEDEGYIPRLVWE